MTTPSSSRRCAHDCPIDLLRSLFALVCSACSFLGGPALKDGPLTSFSRSQLDKVTADAAEFKAGFDKAVYDNAEQQAQVRRVSFCCCSAPIKY